MVPADLPSRRTTTAPRSGFRKRAPEFVLRVDATEIAVSRSRMIIGRSPTADILLDGAAVSRQHAAISRREHGLVLEDLESRNGVFVNGVLIRAPLLLEHGDRVQIGDHELEIVLLARAQTSVIAPEDIQPDTDDDDADDDASTGRIEPLDVLGEIVDRVLDDGDAEEAEALVSGHLRFLLREAENGRPLAQRTVATATRFGLRLAETTGNGAWVDFVLDLHLFTRRLLSTASIRELFRLAPVTRYQERRKLRRYLEFVASQGLGLGAEAPAVLERLSRYGRL